MKSPLSPRQAGAICRDLVPLGERVFDYLQQLEAAGFAAFVPDNRFQESFCGSPGDRELHELCVIEGAMNWLGRPRPMRASQEERRSFYASTRLRPLREELDRENGVPLNEVEARYPGEIWRMEIDPCRRASVLASIRGHDAYQQRWQKEVRDERRRVLVREVAQHATALSSEYGFDRADRYELFTAVMERDSKPLGFSYDKHKSRAAFPVFSKPVGREWDLCWALEDGRAFFMNDREGWFEPYLELRHRELAGSVERAAAGEFLYIRYHQVIPGFTQSYGSFLSPPELETLIKAHLCLYGLMAPQLEAALAGAVAREVGRSEELQGPPP